MSAILIGYYNTKIIKMVLDKIVGTCIQLPTPGYSL